jgi:beta-aspartyl-peptidase (threonine type)
VTRARLVGSANAAVGIRRGIEILRGGGDAVDAVEAVIRAVEDEPSDHTVGYGGYPNADGVVELDASIVDGVTRRAGAVGALRGYREAITVARAVMERTPHVLVVGDGAAALAASIGLEPGELLTDEAAAAWHEWRARTHRGGPADPEAVAGTVDVLALDERGGLVSGVSTSGWAWKHPGRLGDSPIVGAGNAADARFGACACTGWGELAIRAGTAGAVVGAMRAGASIDDACRQAIADVRSLDTDGEPSVMSLVALAPDGSHRGYSTEAGRTYVYWEAGMTEHAEAERAVR